MIDLLGSFPVIFSLNPKIEQFWLGIILVVGQIESQNLNLKG